MDYRVKSKIFRTVEKSRNLFSSDFYNYFFNNPVLLYYSDFSKNWGDFINPFLVEKITGKQVISYKRIYNIKNRVPLYGVGSILHHSDPGLKNAVIWGSGFIYPPKNHIGTPSKILALRGKESAKIFDNLNITHPGIYGDPALIFPTFYNPTREVKYKLGIIPHYSELESFENNIKLSRNRDVRIISPMVKEKNVYEIINKMRECEAIISSSLHGLILADAYQIPSLRFTYSNKLVGGDFKFNDYYSGVGLNSHETIEINDVDNLNIDKILSKCSIKDLKFDPTFLSEVLIDYSNNFN